MNEPIIDIVSYNTLEYVFECLARFNAGHEKIILRAFGGNLSKGIEVAQILQKEVGVSIQKSAIESIRINDVQVPFIEIPLKAGNTKLDRQANNDKETIGEKFGKMNFINYPTYQLLFDWYLKKKGYLKILTRGQRKQAVPLLEIREKDGIRNYEVFKAENLEKKEGIKEEEVINVLYRSGLLMPGKWKEIGKMLSKYDDIILGLDTNIMYRCSITRHLLPMVSLIEPREFVHTPNWVLLVVPSTVMFELEEAANIRDYRDKGLLLHKGRMGFRALQEIMELSENIDIPGISLLIHGETNPIFDTKNTLAKIRKDIHRAIYNLRSEHQFPFHPPKKGSSGDMTIRYQFKRFLSQIDFHKGTFFLTSDKSNYAMAQAEGLHPIYIPYPGIPFRNGSSISIDPVRIPEKVEEDGKQIMLNVPIGNLIYELAISFGEIIISFGEQSPSVECDRKGDDIGCWVHKQLRISNDDLSRLLKNYTGKFNLGKVYNLHKKVTDRFENVEWLTEMGGAFLCN